MNAGGSPVFLLLNGATATGTLDAGRLAAFGLPGAGLGPSARAVDLFGTLGGEGGVAAARNAFLAGAGPGLAPPAGALGRYNFNNCVFTSTNCVAPLAFQPPPLTPLNQVRLSAEAPRNDESDVQIPNVPDRDF